MGRPPAIHGRLKIGLFRGDTSRPRCRIPCFVQPHGIRQPGRSSKNVDRFQASALCMGRGRRKTAPHDFQPDTIQAKRCGGMLCPACPPHDAPLQVGEATRDHAGRRGLVWHNVHVQPSHCFNAPARMIPLRAANPTCRAITEGRQDAASLAP